MDSDWLSFCLDCHSLSCHALVLTPASAVALAQQLLPSASWASSPLKLVSQLKCWTVEFMCSEGSHVQLGNLARSALKVRPC